MQVARDRSPIEAVLRRPQLHVARHTAADKKVSVFCLFLCSPSSPFESKEHTAGGQAYGGRKCRVCVLFVFCPQAPSSTSYFAQLQVAKRTAADKKGGHLTKRKSDGRLLLRESAMVSDEDKPAFEDISKCAAAPEPQP